MGRFVLLAWLVTVALAYAALGGTFGMLIEGYDRARMAWWPVLATVASGVVAFALTVRWQMRPGGAAGDTPTPSARRRFLVGAATTGAGVMASAAAVVARNFGWFDTSARHIFLVSPPQVAPEYEKAWAGSTVREYRRLGRTDARVSDISLGSGSSTGGRLNVAAARYAIEQGINYFDTAPDYAAEGSEKILGEAMKGHRHQMFLATKFCNPHGHLGPGDSVADYMEAVEASLVRLQTDYVDLIHVHSCDSVARLLDPNVHEAFDRLKEQGKARFLGVSTHTPDLETVATAALDSGRFDVMMLAYHFGAWPKLAEIIDRAAREDVGVVAMKTLRGAKHEGLLWSRDERDTYCQAAFKWVLANPAVSALVISIWDQKQIDEYLYASGARLEARDLAVLERYQELTAGKHCRQHCGACLSSCSEGLPIHDVLRHRMYFEQGAEKEAMRLYAKLERDASVCAGCSAPCAQACPDGIAIPERMAGAHDLLTLG